MASITSGGNNPDPLLLYHRLTIISSTIAARLSIGLKSHAGAGLPARPVAYTVSAAEGEPVARAPAQPQRKTPTIAGKIPAYPDH